MRVRVGVPQSTVNNAYRLVVVIGYIDGVQKMACMSDADFVGLRHAGEAAPSPSVMKDWIVLPILGNNWPGP